MALNTFLFVYGTLKRGKGNHPILQRAKYIGPALTIESYKFVDLGWYPAIRPVPGPRPVKGELYQINEKVLQNVDLLEGHPEFYFRHSSWVRLEHKTKPQKAWIYFLPEDYKENTEIELLEGTWE